MTLSQAHQSVGARVVYRSVSGMELHGEIRYATGQFTFVVFDNDRTLTPKAVATELLLAETKEI